MEKKIEINVNIIVESIIIMLSIVNYIYVYLKKIYLLGRKY